MTELWRPIPGYEGYYEASNLGRIRSLGRVAYDESTHMYRCRNTGKILKPQLHYNEANSGYKPRYVITLCKDGVQKTHILPRLIAMAWIDGYEEGLTVDHIDGNPLNNRIDNLEWVTWQENLNRGYRKGIMKQVPVILESEEGTQHSFVSRRDASKFLGRHPQYLSSMIGNNCLFAYSTDGTKYKIIKGREKLHA